MCVVVRVRVRDVRGSAFCPMRPHDAAPRTGVSRWDPGKAKKRLSPPRPLMPQMSNAACGPMAIMRRPQWPQM
jgi:hypothetical protein